jgi:hypothetical protein
MHKLFALAGLVIVACGCTVGPNYKKPVANGPKNNRR